LSLCSKPLSKYLFWLRLSAPLQQARRVFGLALDFRSLRSKPLQEHLIWLQLSAQLQRARRVFGLALVGLLSLWLRFDLL